MPYKDPQKARNYAKEAMKRKREGITEEGITKGSGITQYHPILYALVNPEKRKKLISICEALGKRSLQSKVYLGCGAYSLPFDIAEDLLEATVEQK